MILGDPLFCPLPPHHANNRMWVECCDTTQRPLRFLYHHIPAVEEPRSLQSRLRLQRKYTHVIKCIVQKHNVWALFYCTRWEREKKSGYLSLHHDRISSRGAAVQVFLSFIHSFIQNMPPLSISCRMYLHRKYIQHVFSFNCSFALWFISHILKWLTDEAQDCVWGIRRLPQCCSIS